MIILSGCIIRKGDTILLLKRSDHNHFETPGGKVEPDECADPDNPSMEELKSAAIREIHEELGTDFTHTELEFFGKVEFQTPDGRKAIANKFLTELTGGKPVVNEPDQFDRLEYIPIKDLESRNISPDLRILLPQILKTLKNDG